MKMSLKPFNWNLMKKKMLENDIKIFMKII